MLAFCILFASQKVGTIGREGIIYRCIAYIHDGAGRRCCVTLTPCGVDGKIAIIIRCTFRVLLGGACFGLDPAVRGSTSGSDVIGRQTCRPYGIGDGSAARGVPPSVAEPKGAWCRADITKGIRVEFARVGRAP